MLKGGENVFVAELENGARVNLVTRNLSLDQLKKLRHQNAFYCPVCHAPVLPKLGLRKKWHFSHKPEEGCLIELEAESEIHLCGKQLLHDWAAESGEAVELEHYLPTLKQRPDLYLPGIEPLAIEYQCSTIPEQLIDARTTGYLRAGIDPVWILGGGRHRRTGGSLRVTGFEQHTIRRSPPVPANPGSFSSSFYVLYFDPQVKKMIVENLLFPVSKTRFIAGEMKISLQDFRLHRLKSPVCSFSVERFQSLLLYEKRKIRLRPPGRTSAEEQWLRRQAYLRRRHFSFMPAFIGLPHETYLHFSVPPFLWQYWVYLLLCCCTTGTWLTPEQILGRSQECGGDRLFVRRKMPMCPAASSSELIRTYLTQLVRLHFAQQRADSFCLSPDAFQNGSLPELLNQDQAILERLEVNSSRINTE